MSERHKAIREVRSYVDDKGRKVNEFVQVFGKTREPNIYRGEAMTKVVSVHPVTGQPVPQNMNFEFPFPDGTTLKKAFDTFDETAQVWIDKHQKQRQEQAKANRVVGARSMPRLMGPDGKPLGGKG